MFACKTLADGGPALFGCFGSASEGDRGAACVRRCRRRFIVAEEVGKGFFLPLRGLWCPMPI